MAAPRPPREPREALCVAEGHDYVTLSIDGPPEIAEPIMAYMKSLNPMLVIGRGGGNLGPSRDDPNRVGLRYTNFVFNMELFRAHMAERNTPTT